MTSFAPASSIAAPGVGRRPIILRTQGRRHGPIIRLMSPGDLGERVKPFIFLDLFQGDMRLMSEAMGLHPHSGIATVTVFTEGDVRYDDPTDGQGSIAYGGVEWMRAGGGVWHGKELSAGESSLMQGFQLWIALPPELENGPVQSQYIEAPAMPQVGPAHVILGRHEGIASPVQAPSGINYLLVTLQSGEHWDYIPPEGHSVGWVAIAKGEMERTARAGEMAIFEHGSDSIQLLAGPDGATFVLGSAVPHPHDLHLGYYSVHTSAQALVAGEDKIARLREALLAQGNRRTNTGSVPVFKG